MANGILIIDKPAGWTSMDVCAKLRGLLQTKRVGHAGTLDPMATGVLPVFAGRATRAVEFASGSDKEYVAGLRLGLVTDTQDITGRVLESCRASVDLPRLRSVLSRFQGDILQIPPMYSAIKVGGKKLYQLARKGREVERAPRPITIRSIRLEGQTPEGDYILRVRCSKGTYIRTLCHDIGQALGCGGAMSSLRRTEAAGFTLEQAVPLQDVICSDDPASFLLPVDTCFSGCPALDLSPREEQIVRTGGRITRTGLADGDYRLYGAEGEFLALAAADAGLLTPRKRFFAPPEQLSEK